MKRNRSKRLREPVAPSGYTSHAWMDYERASIYHIPEQRVQFITEKTKSYPEGWIAYTLRSDLAENKDPKAVRQIGLGRSREEGKALLLREIRKTQARQNPTRTQWFTPSYEADSLADYREKVEQGNKRDLHRMVQEGRRGMRYGEGALKQTPATLQTRTTRWVDQQPPWEARTQAQAVRDVSFLHPAARKGEPAPPTLAARIQAGLQAYQQATGSTVGLIVPSTPEPLLRTGVPARAAAILVQRAAGAFFPEVEPVSTAPAPVTLAQFVQALSRDLNGVLSLRRDGNLELKRPDEQRGWTVAGFALKFEDKPLLRLPLTAARIQEAYAIAKETPDFRYVEDAPRVLTRILGILFRLVRTGTEDFTVPAELRVALESAGKQEVRRIPVGEHFIFGTKEAEAPKIEYRSLRNVTLAELPALLARLAVRKKKRGRKLSAL
jgi:hypothetical protein